MKARIDSAVRVRRKDLSDEIYSRAISDLTAINVDKERALSESIRGAQFIPDFIELWSERGGDVIFPRGFAHRLEQIAGELGQEIEWESNMILLPPSENLFRDWPVADLRDYQRPARDAMLDWGQGIIQAPTGSGKSRTVLEFVRWAGQKTLVIVGKVSLAKQWQEVVQDVYGYESGYIGEGAFDVRNITLATWQTLWARKNDIPADFWEQFGCVVGDEIHHAGAASLSELMGLFPAYYRIGVSATPKWDASSWPIVRALFGPVIHQTTHEDVGEMLVTPSVVMVESDFEAEFIGTHFKNGRRIQNNFAEIMAALVDYSPRNDLISDIALRDAREGHHVLIVTRRIEHVKQLVSRLEDDLKIGTRLHALTGAQSGDDARRIAKVIDDAEEGTVTISTIADEGIDIPRLDRLILAFPVRKTPLVEQQIGRISRPALGKVEAVVYDVADDGVGPLIGQRAQRERLYARRRWAVSAYEREESLV